MPRDPKRLWRIGALGKAHGLSGELYFRPDEPGSRTVMSQENIFLRDRQGQVEERKIVAARPANDGVLLLLEGATDRTTAQLLTGREVLLPRDRLPEAEEGEFLVADLMGLEVRNVAGQRLGAVADVSGAGDVPVLIVQGGSREWQIPLVDTFVRRIDVQGGAIEVEPPEEVEA